MDEESTKKVTVVGGEDFSVIVRELSTREKQSGERP